MAVESSIEADAGWFLGEAKTLRYTLVDGDNAGAWALRWELRRRRSDVEPAVVKETNAGVTGGAGFVQVAIAAADTLGLTPGSHHYVLWRVDVGNEAVLAYGGVVLNEVTEA